MPKRFRPMLIQFLLDFVGEPADRAIVDVAGQAQALLGGVPCDLLILPVDVARVLGRDLDLFGDARIADGLTCPGKVSRLAYVTPGRRRISASVLSRSSAWPRTLSALRRETRFGLSHVDFSRSSSRPTASRLRQNASQRRSSTMPSAPAGLGQAQVGVVLAQLQAVLGAAGEHPVGLA